MVAVDGVLLAQYIEQSKEREKVIHSGKDDGFSCACSRDMGDWRHSIR